MCSRYCSEHASKNCTIALQHHACVLQQNSKLVSEKQLEKWDKEIPSVSLTRVLALNLKEWWMILIGILGAAVTGGILPVFALFSYEILWAIAFSPEQVQVVRQRSLEFLSLCGLVGATGLFVKVRC